MCGSTAWIEMHHIFNGTANRRLSDKYGYIVPLCHYCHNEPPNGVHFNRENDLKLKRWAQTDFEKTHSRNEFIEIFGKSYL